MFTIWKPLTHILRWVKASRKSLAKWWLEMSDQEQREVMRRGLVTAGSAFAVCITLPSITVQYQDHRADADFRAEAKALALADAAADANSAREAAPSLMQHPWMQTVEYALERDPRAALSRYAMRDRDGIAVSSVVNYEPNQIDEAEDIAAEHRCLSEAVYYEARSESTSGQLAVAEVIMNRVRDHRFPNSVCEVVYQGATRTTGCQFTFTCDGALNRKPRGRKWEAAQTVATHVLMDLHERRTGSATHYHATYVDPLWNAGLVRTNRIDTHIFYRFPRGSEWARAQRAVERKRATLEARVAAAEKSHGGGQPADTSVSVMSPAP
ncbi:MAG: cell wall hydrolase [Pseudomonadota bacterium]